MKLFEPKLALFLLALTVFGTSYAQQTETKVRTGPAKAGKKSTSHLKTGAKKAVAKPSGNKPSSSKVNLDSKDKDGKTALIRA